MDRFQPTLPNCATEGAARQKHNVTSDRVIARNRHIAEGAEAVWAHAADMIKQAVVNGYLRA